MWYNIAILRWLTFLKGNKKKNANESLKNHNQKSWRRSIILFVPSKKQRRKYWLQSKYQWPIMKRCRRIQRVCNHRDLHRLSQSWQYILKSTFLKILYSFKEKLQLINYCVQLRQPWTLWFDSERSIIHWSVKLTFSTINYRCCSRFSFLKSNWHCFSNKKKTSKTFYKYFWCI